MKLRIAACVCVMLLAAVAFVQAQDAAGDKAKKPRPGRLTMPWNKISSLSDEQKTKIREIHGKAVAEIRAIEERERDEVMALLNDEQKAEAQKLLDEQKKPRASAKEGEGETAPAKVEEKKSAPGE